MSSENDLPISTLVGSCFVDFNSLLKLMTRRDDSRPKLDIEDDLGRLRVWAGNFGAHRKLKDRLSLDHRLREATDLRHEVQNHLLDISEALKGAISSLSEESRSFSSQEYESYAAFENDTSGSEGSDSDEDDFWEQIRAENNQHSRLEEYQQDIQFTITSLYKLSVALQNPVHRDRTAKASEINLRYCEPYDIEHVAMKFGLKPDSALAQRLGKANTVRRQLLAYHKCHAEKISSHIDDSLGEQKDEPDDRNEKEDTGVAKSISTKWTQETTVSTIRPLDADVLSESGRTRFSTATSTASSGEQKHLLDVPPPPKPRTATASSDSGDSSQLTTILCPYCYQAITFETIESWKYHVYGDLRPYICTFGNCAEENELYDSYTQWKDHEQQFHRREWICGDCSSSFQEESLFTSHIDEFHGTILPGDQRQAIIKLSERAVSSTQQCPLCTKSMSDTSRFQQHLARHLRQIALFVLPSIDNEEIDEEEALDMQVDKESNQSRDTLSSVTSSSSVLDYPQIEHPVINHFDSNVRRGLSDDEKESDKEKDKEPEAVPLRQPHSQSKRPAESSDSSRSKISRVSRKEKTSSAANDLQLEFESSHSHIEAQPEPPSSLREFTSECCICNAKFRKSGTLAGHLSDQHYPQVQFFCLKPDCNVTMNRRDRILNHVRYHNGDSTTQYGFKIIEHTCPATCPLCSNTTNSWKAFYECMLSHCVVEEQPSIELAARDLQLELESSSPHTQFKPPSSLRSNPDEKDAESTSECCICNKKFRKSGTLARHLSDQHYPQVQFICLKPDCNVMMNRRDRMLNHVRCHTGDSTTQYGFKIIERACPATCPLCSNTTNSWRDFYECMLSHCMD